MRFASLERRDVIVWRLENGVATILYMVLDFHIIATRNSEECFVGDGLRGRHHDMTSLRVLRISCEEKICSFVLLYNKFLIG